MRESCTIILKIVSEHCSSRWKSVNGWYSTGFGFVSRKIHSTRTDLKCVVALHQVLNEVKKAKRLLLPSTIRCQVRPFHIGEQMRWEVQHWLSPPDPSTNQNVVRKARLIGTAAWFFESCALAEWKPRGSLLWIHGKRTFF